MKEINCSVASFLSKTIKCHDKDAQKSNTVPKDWFTNNPFSSFLLDFGEMGIKNQTTNDKEIHSLFNYWGLENFLPIFC